MQFVLRAFGRSSSMDKRSRPPGSRIAKSSGRASRGTELTCTPYVVCTANRRRTLRRAHALRSLSGTASMFCLFAAVTMLPLADLTAITFTAPMFLTVLAMVFLGERIHRFRWTALGIG